jgi:hypothetical protein
MAREKECMEIFDKKDTPRFEDPEDMMDFAYEHLIESIYHFTLCVKLVLPEADKEILKALLTNFIEVEVEDLFPRLVPCVESYRDQCVVYGLIYEKKDK